MSEPRYARRRRAAVPAALAAFTLLVVLSGAHTPLTWAGGSPFTPAMTIVLPPQQAVVAPVDGVSEPVTDPLPLDDGGGGAATSAGDGGSSDSGGGSGGTRHGGAHNGTTDHQPPIRHVFVVMLSQTDLVALAGGASAAHAARAARRRGHLADASPAPTDPPTSATTPAPASTATYFATRLVPRGTLLTEYDAVARGSLANGVALLSGQGPTAQTLADCPTSAGAAAADVTPDTLGDDGQQLGDGCVYPFATGTMPDQLTGAGLDWRAYVEHAGGACPAIARNPFAYFHSLLDTGACARHVAGIDGLDADLARGRDAPALMYVVPGACHDGRATPCAAGAPAGPAAADAFLKDVVGRILASAAYADGGLIAITSDGPPPPPPPQPTPTAPAPPPPPTTPVPPPPDTTSTTPTPPTPPPGQTTATVTPPTPGQTTTPAPQAAPRPTAARAASASAPVPATYPNVGDALAAGVARVGALLISPAVGAGATSDMPANHFTLLRAISDLFALQPLGYAGAADLKPFPESVLRPNRQ